MFNQRNGDIADLTYRHQVKRNLDGYGVIEGLGVSLGSSGSTIEFEVDAGAAQFNGEREDFPPDNAVSDPGDGEERYDAVVALDDGSVDTLKGDPGDHMPPDTARQDVVVLAVVRIPANAGSTDDLDEENDISDRRLPAIEGLGSGERQTERFPLTAIEDGGSVSTPVLLQPGQTLEMYRWGAIHVDDGDPQGLPSGVEVQLVNPSGNVIQTGTEMLETGDPIFSVDADGNDVQPYLFRLYNDSGTDWEEPEGLGAVFDHVIVN